MPHTWRLIRTGLTILRKPLVVRTGPIHFQLEPATGCNLLCQTCRVPQTAERKVMTLDQFRQAFDQIRPLKVGLSGSGEPFFNRDMLEIIRYAQRRGAAVLTTTNFTMCHNMLEDLVDSGLVLLKVSLDAATAPTYLRIRGKDFFQRILDDIRALQAIKARRGSRTPFLRLQFVIQRDNLGEIAAFAELAASLGANSVYYQPLDSILVPEGKDLATGVTTERLITGLRAAQQYARAAHIGTNARLLLRHLPDYYRKYQVVPDKPPARVCLLPWFSVYITVDGDVRPCCSFRETETLVMGNLFTEPFTRIWNNEKYQAFRRAARERKLLYEVCRNCIPNRLRDFVGLSAVLPGFFWAGATADADS